MGLDTNTITMPNLLATKPTVPNIAADVNLSAPAQISPQLTSSEGNIFSQPTDKQALALARSIALKESGNNGAPNYNAIGDNGTAAGSGQWSNQNAQGIAQPLSPGEIPANFKTTASKYGLNPNDFSPQNQDKVLYAEVYNEKKQGLSPGQIAAAHNAGMAKALDGSWQQNVGVTTINGKQIAYNTPAYVDQVQQIYNKQLANLGSLGQGQNTSPQGQSGTQGQTTPQLTQGAPGQISGIPVPGSKPSLSALETNLEKVPGELASAGNSLVPIVGDVANDITGKNNKTALQQGGDAVQSALSAALLIPGAQPEDLAAKAGLTGLTARLGANAVVGGLLGASNAVGKGQSAGQVALQGAEGIGLGTAGGLVGGLLKTPSVEDKLQSAIQDTMPLADKSTRIEALQDSLPTGEGVQRKGLLGTSSIQPNAHDVEVGKSALPYVQGTSDPVVKIQNLNQGIKDVSQDTDNFLDKNSAPSNFGDMRDYVEANNQPAPGLKDDPSAFEAFQRTSQRALNTLNKVMTDTAKATEDFGPVTPGSDIRQARIAIDQQIKTELKGATLGSPQYTGIKAAAVSARNVLNRMSEDMLRYPGQLEQLNRYNADLGALQERGIDITSEAQNALKAKYGLTSTAESEANATKLSAQHKTMSNLFEARDNLIDKTQGSVGKNKIQETIANSPVAKAAVGVAKKTLPFGIGNHL